MRKLYEWRLSLIDALHYLLMEAVDKLEIARDKTWKAWRVAE